MRFRELRNIRMRRYSWRCFAAVLLGLTFGVGAGADSESSGSTVTQNRVRLRLNDTVDRVQACFFDSVDGGLIHYIDLYPPDWDVTATDAAEMVSDRIYGCFVRGFNERADETVFSDTVYAAWRVLSQNLEITVDATTIQTAISETAPDAPGRRAHNYPNPFNPREEETTIVFEPDRAGRITLSIYDLFGNLVFEDGFTSATDLRWSGRNGRGELVASGGYICLLKIDGEIVSKHKIVVVK